MEVEQTDQQTNDNEDQLKVVEQSTPESSTGLYYGDPLLTWEVDEYPRHTRSRRWYLVAGVLGLGLILYAVLTADFLFAVIILMSGIIMLATSFAEPKRIEIILTTLGAVVGNKFYDYRGVRDFSIAYNPPAVKNLYMDFHSALNPLLSIPLEDTDPNEVRDCLGAFCRENLNRTDESLTDRLRRVYKL